MWNRKRLSPATLLLLLLIGFLSWSLLFHPQPVKAATGTFGKTTAGSASWSDTRDMVYGNVATCTESGTADSISVLMKAGSSPTTENMKCAIYRHSDSVLVGTTEEKSIVLTTSLQNFTFAFVGTKPTITAQIYVLTVMFDFPAGGGEAQRTYLSSDNGVANAFHYIIMTYNNYPNPASFTSLSGDATIWCTYSTEIPALVSGSSGTNTTLVARNWLFHSQWFMSIGTLSGFIFSYNASTSMVNDTWVPFAETNNSWANVSKLVSNNLATVIQWTVYANGSSNSWNVIVNQYASATAELTCYFNTGGFVRLNGTNMGNGTALTYGLAISIANLGALSSNASYGFGNFTWSIGLSGSSTINSYNLTLYNCTTLWCYFIFQSGGAEPSRAGYAAYWFAGLLVILLIAIPTVVILLRRK